MDIPLELSFHNVEPSDALKASVQAHVQKLEQFHDHIIGCRVSIEMPHKSQKASGNPPDVHILIRVPGKEIVVSRERRFDHAHEDVYVAMRDAFDAARRRLEDYVRRMRGFVKSHAGPRSGERQI